MNIFLLDRNHTLCAQYHCDKHLIKMITEHNQILCSVYYSNNLKVFSNRKLNNNSLLLKERNEVFENFPRKKDGEIHPYGLGYIHHPCTKWAAKSYKNWKWLIELNIALCKEYTYRYNKIHKGEHITNWCLDNVPLFNFTEITKFAQAMDDKYKITSDPFENYRIYYTFDKSHLHTWTKREQPEFINKIKLKYDRRTYGKNAIC